VLRNTASIAAVICFGLSQSAYAQSDSGQQRCSKSIVSLVGQHIGIGDFSFPRSGASPSVENGGVITAGACKVWPINRAVTIAAFAYDDESDVNGTSLVIALVDNIKGKVISTYKGGQMDFAGFGVAEDGLRLDTARYDLAPGVRSFGVDVTERYNPNCGDGGVGSMRTLFVQDGATIRPVLEQFITSSWRFVKGGNPRCLGAEAAKETVTEDTSYSISISHAATKGYANLLITEASSYSNGDQSKQKSSQYELRYDGVKYADKRFPVSSPRRKAR
jgi:hypothetical protein